MHSTTATEVSFSYKLQKMGWLPIIPLTLASSNAEIRTEAYVDSGAHYSIFQMELAYLLGLNQAHAKKKNFVVGDGNHISSYIYRLKVGIADSDFIAEIAFSEKLRIGFNLLGRKDVFTHYTEIAFQETKRKIIFRQ